MSDWYPVGTHPHREFECLWWVVPKTAEETWCNTSGDPIVSKSKPRILMGQYGSWGCLCKATHWMPLPSPPTVGGEHADQA